MNLSVKKEKYYNKKTLTQVGVFIMQEIKK